MTISEFQPHPGRGRVNAAFFSILDLYLNSFLASKKSAAFADLPPDVVEVGPGIGANFRFLRPGTHMVAIEPNPYMQPALRRRAALHGIDLEIKSAVGEAIDLPDQSVSAVISSLVLCSVRDPDRVVSEIRRILRPGGRYAFVEHVVADEGSATRYLQHLLARPWGWFFEGCSVERDLGAVIERAGFATVEMRHEYVRSPFLPANPLIDGTATA